MNTSTNSQTKGTPNKNTGRIDGGSPPKKKATPLQKWVVGIAALIIFLMILHSKNSPPSSSGSDSALTVGDLKWEEEPSGDIDVPGTWYVTGTVTNNSDKQLSYVQVEINVYDDAGNQVESTMANGANLDAHGTWKFRALVISKNFKTARLKAVTGY